MAAVKQTAGRVLGRLNRERFESFHVSLKLKVMHFTSGW